MQQSLRVPFSLAIPPSRTILSCRTLAATDRLPPLSILGHQTSSYESAGSAFSIGLWRQLPTQCVFAGSREGTFSPTHVPKYLLYQACDVWDCFPVDKAFHSTMKAPKIEVNAHVFGIACNKLFLALCSYLCCSLCQEYPPRALISLTLIL